MSMGRGIASFAAGFGQSYFKEKERMKDRQLQEEKFGLEKQRMQLENDRLQQDKQMRDELGRLESDTKPTPGFVVDGPDGRTVYTDQASAQAHADSAGGQARQVFVVGGKTFDNQEAAAAAAEASNSPAVRLRKKAAVYAKYGREDLESAAMQNYKLHLDNSRREIQQQFLNARAMGDVKSVVDAYNKQLPNGVQAELVPAPDGTELVQLTRNGQPVGKPAPFNWDQMQQQVMAAPDNMVEIWKTAEANKRQDQALGYQGRQVAVQEKTGAAQVAHVNAQTADIPAAAADRRTQANATATGAAAATTNAQTGVRNADTADYAAHTQRMQLTRPSISAVPDAQGGLNFVAPGMTLDAQGNWVMGKPQVQPAAGLQYPAGYVAQQRNSLGGLGLTPPGSGTGLDPNAINSVMQQMQQEAERRKAERGAAPAAAPAAPAAAVPGAPPAGANPMKPVSFNRLGGIDTQRLASLVMDQESDGQRYGRDGKLLTSGAGAKGEMQVMDATNKSPGYGVMPARDNSPEERARVGRDYLNAMVHKFGGDVPKALAAYNAGPGAVQRAIKKSKGGDWLAFLPKETRNYVAEITQQYHQRPQVQA